MLFDINPTNGIDTDKTTRRIEKQSEERVYVYLSSDKDYLYRASSIGIYPCDYEKMQELLNRLFPEEIIRSKFSYQFPCIYI